MNRSPASPTTMRIIKLSHAAGVLLFGAVILLLQSRGSLPDADLPLDPAVVRYAFLALCAGAAGGIIVLRGQAARAPTFQKRAGLTIAAWAVGEAVALLGGVHWMLSGGPALYLIGLAVFLVGLLTVPIPTTEGLAG